MNLNSHYTVETNEEAFIVNSTLTAPKTAVVRYFDKDGDEYFSRKYGVVEPSYIYKKINNGTKRFNTFLYFDSCEEKFKIIFFFLRNYKN